MQLTKVKMMKKRADQLKDADFHPVNLTVNFKIDGPNRFGVTQKPCIDCGDCFPGCNGHLIQSDADGRES